MEFRIFQMSPGVHLSAAYLSLCNHLGQALLAKNAHFSGSAVNKAVFHVKQLEVFFVSRETTRGFLCFTWNMFRFSLQNIGVLVNLFQLLGNSSLVDLISGIETNLGDLTRNSSSPNPIE